METASPPARLFRLQQLDASIEQLDSRLNEIRQRQRSSSEVLRSESELDKARAREKAAASEQRRLEADLADLEAKLKRAHQRLYGGTVVDSRELASLERELAHLTETRDRAEDELLALMERAEAGQLEVDELSRGANEARDRWESDRPSLDQEESDMTDELAGLRDEREKLLEQVDPTVLNLYRRLHKASGHAVSKVAGGVCEWCRVVIPPKDIQHARAGALVYCTNCSRILYVD